MFHAQIGFIGGGNMARSIISGMLANSYEPRNLWVVDPDPRKRDDYCQMGVNTAERAESVISRLDIVVIAVKPQSIQALADEIKAVIKKARPLVISIVTGITLSRLQEWFGQETAIVRVMPNTPSLLKCGAAGMYANDNVARQQREGAEHIMRSVGVTTWLDSEDQIDIVGAISGSGPAYYFLLMEAIKDTGIELGLNEQQAHLLTVQTAYGAARMALESGDTLETLRQNVTSPGGITEVALKRMETDGIRETMRTALYENLDHSKALAGLFDQQTTPRLGEDDTQSPGTGDAGKDSPQQ